MKLNLWQVVGVILLVAGVVWFIVREKSKEVPTTNPTTATLVR